MPNPFTLPPVRGPLAALAAAASLVTGAGALSTSARADVSSVPISGSWISRGAITDAASTDTNHLVVAGRFDRLGPKVGGLAAVKLSDASPSSIEYDVNGPVQDSVADGHGGVFIAGDFTEVDGQQQANLAHLLANGRLDVSWRPFVDSSALHLALVGTNLFVAGGFERASNDDTTPGRADQLGIVAFDAQSGSLQNWAANIRADSPGTPHDGRPAVTALTANGSSLYFAGDFTSVDGQPRNGLAAVSVTDGHALDWKPTVSSSNGNAPEINRLAVADGTAYIAGRFDGIGGESRHALAAVDAATGAVTNWNPQLNTFGDANNVYGTTLAVANGTLYTSGFYTGVNTTANDRKGFAAFDLGSGSLTTWNPALSTQPDYPEPVAQLLPIASGVLIGGALVNQTDGTKLNWDPYVFGSVSSDVVIGSTVVLGGDLRSIGGVARAGVAQLDASTGAPTSWTLAPGGITANATAVQLVGSRLFVAGSNGTGQGVWAYDAATGALDATWHAPATNGEITGLASSGTSLYIAGTYSRLGGVARAGLGSVSLNDGSVTSWNPSPSPAPATPGQSAPHLAVGDGVVYAGGYFTSIGGQARAGLAALDSVTGQARAWNPQLTRTDAGQAGVYRMAYAAHALYVSGAFEAVGRTPRNELAAIDTTTGQATTWDGASSASVDERNMPIDDLSLAGDHLFVLRERAGNISLRDLSVTTGAPRALAAAQSFALDARVVANGDASRLVVFAGDAAPLLYGPSATSTVPAPPVPSPTTTPSVLPTATAPEAASPVAPQPAAATANPSPLSPASSPTAARTAPTLASTGRTTAHNSAKPAITAPRSVTASKLTAGVKTALSGARPRSPYTAKLMLSKKTLFTTRGKTNASGGASITMRLSNSAMKRLRDQRSFSIVVSSVSATGPVTIKQTISIH